jgi:hypothetical protein
MVMVDDAMERTLAWMSGQCKKQWAVAQNPFFIKSKLETLRCAQGDISNSLKKLSF